jgi:hypothetical protein
MKTAKSWCSSCWKTWLKILWTLFFRYREKNAENYFEKRKMQRKHFLTKSIRVLTQSITFSAHISPVETNACDIVSPTATNQLEPSILMILFAFENWISILLHQDIVFVHKAVCCSFSYVKWDDDFRTCLFLC